MGTSPAMVPTDIEARTLRKLRTRIIPFVFVLFVVNFLDRANIAFAALTMNKELAITSQQYGFIAGIFFLGYFIFEIPSNLMLHKLGARIWIARILISWGIVAMLTGFVKAAIHLYVVRFLLGVAEAGFFPGIVLYLTYWFRQRQLAHAIALFCAANPVANITRQPAVRCDSGSRPLVWIRQLEVVADSGGYPSYSGRCAPHTFCCPADPRKRDF